MRGGAGILFLFTTENEAGRAAKVSVRRTALRVLCVLCGEKGAVTSREAPGSVIRAPLSWCEEAGFSGSACDLQRLGGTRWEQWPTTRGGEKEGPPPSLRRR